MVPGQQDNGRGLGQMVKEALVYSTINAGMNRLINPHQHYMPDYSRPAGSSGTSETHITYNNNYFNGAPADNTPPVSAPVGNIPLIPTSPNASPANVPASYPANYPIPVNNPAITPGGSIPVIAGNNATYSSSSMNTAGVANRMGSPPVAPPDGLPANNVINNQGTPDQNTNTVYNPQYKISNSDLWTLTEELFSKQEVDTFKNLTLHLQSKSANVTDAASGP